MKKDKLLEILQNIENIKVAVIGDIMLDDYLIGDVDRISPEAPVPVVNIKEERFVLGGAANVINNLSSLGVKTYALGMIGQDDNGERLLREFERQGVDSSLLVSSASRPTIVKRRVIAHNQQLLRLDWEKKAPISSTSEDFIINNISEILEEVDAIILSDYDKGVLTPKVAKEIIKMAKKAGKIITVDPKPSNIKNYIGATSMTPNRKEAIEALNNKEITNVDEIAHELREKLGLTNILLTKSEEGMCLIGDTNINIPTFAKDVYDVTGAGDTVIATFTCAAAAGASWEEAAKIANTAAGIVVGRVGTSTASKEEIIDFYDEIYHEWN